MGITYPAVKLYLVGHSQWLPASRQWNLGITDIIVTRTYNQQPAGQFFQKTSFKFQRVFQNDQKLYITGLMIY